MSEPTDFLYPMIDGAETDAEALLDDLARSAAEKAAISADVTATVLADLGDELDTIAEAMGERFARGGRLFTCGNGGSATDADGIAALFASPPSGMPLGARSFVADVSVITALANDIGFDSVYARQLDAHATPDDVVMGLSTSGNSRNLLEAFRTGRRRGLLTIGVAGDRGGAMATCDDLDHCLVVPATSIHRIQEAQSALAFALWQRVQRVPGVQVPTRGART